MIEPAIAEAGSEAKDQAVAIAKLGELGPSDGDNLLLCIFGHVAKHTTNNKRYGLIAFGV